jgi:hypothetical protein
MSVPGGDNRSPEDCALDRDSTPGAPGVIASGGPVAGLAYFARVSLLIPRFGPNPRLAVAAVAAAVILAFALTWVAAARPPVPAAATEPPGGRNGFGLLRHDAHVRWIALLVAASCCVGWVLEQRVPGTVAEPWSPSGNFTLRALVLIVQIGLLPLLLPRLSVRWILLVAPALALVEVGLQLALPGAWSTLPVRLVDSVGSAWGTVAAVALLLGASRKLGAAATTALASTIEWNVSGGRPRQAALGLSGFTRFGTTANTQRLPRHGEERQLVDRHGSERGGAKGRRGERSEARQAKALSEREEQHYQQKGGGVHEPVEQRGTEAAPEVRYLDLA